MPIQQVPEPGQVVDSNQYGLAALVKAAGGIPIQLGIVPDRLQVLRQVVQQALASADGVISSGGVSVGDFDLVEKVLEELGGEIFIRSVAIKPGKPLTVARFPNPHGPPKLYFGLPGNPASALVTFWRFLHPALRKMGGSCPPTGRSSPPSARWICMPTVSGNTISGDGCRSGLRGSISARRQPQFRQSHQSGRL